MKILLVFLFGLTAGWWIDDRGLEAVGLSWHELADRIGITGGPIPASGDRADSEKHCQSTICVDGSYGMPISIAGPIPSSDFQTDGLLPKIAQVTDSAVLMAAQGPNGKAAIIRVDDAGHVICSKE